MDQRPYKILQLIWPQEQEPEPYCCAVDGHKGYKTNTKTTNRIRGESELSARSSVHSWWLCTVKEYRRLRDLTSFDSKTRPKKLKKSTMNIFRRQEAWRGKRPCPAREVGAVFSWEKGTNPISWPINLCKFGVADVRIPTPFPWFYNWIWRTYPFR